MIPFVADQLFVEHVYLKSVTTALGGSIQVVDDERSTPEQDVYKKIKAPMAVVRKFVEDNKKISRYLKPVLTAVTYYGDHVVALERHPYNVDGDLIENLAGELVHWVSHSEHNIDKYVAKLTLNDGWFIDGTYIYTFSDNDMNTAESISADGKFKSVNVRAYKLASIHDSSKMSSPEDRTCLLYTAAKGQRAMSPPIWKSLSGVGGKALAMTEDEDTGMAHTDALGVVTGNHQFDRINETLAVNLAFALTAGKKISDVFGYDSIEPLGLDELMVQLRTVNLPRVAKEVKQTFDSGMPFTHAVAWLLGLTTRAESLDGYIVLRSLLKYLTTKGIYRKNSFLPSAVYRPDQSQDNVPMMSIEEAHAATQERMRKIGGRPVAGWASKEALAALETGE